MAVFAVSLPNLDYKLTAYYNINLRGVYLFKMHISCLQKLVKGPNVQYVLEIALVVIILKTSITEDKGHTVHSCLKW